VLIALTFDCYLTPKSDPHMQTCAESHTQSHAVTHQQRNLTFLNKSAKDSSSQLIVALYKLCA